MDEYKGDVITVRQSSLAPTRVCSCPIAPRLCYWPASPVGHQRMAGDGLATQLFVRILEGDAEVEKSWQTGTVEAAGSHPCKERKGGADSLVGGGQPTHKDPIS